MKKDIYVQILEYIKEQPLGVVTFEELKNKFSEYKELIHREVEANKILSPIDGKWASDSKFSLSFEDNFRLMEHQELVEARKSAKFAFWVAIISITLNIGALLVTAYSTAKVEVVNQKNICSSTK